MTFDFALNEINVHSGNT